MGGSRCDVVNFGQFETDYEIEDIRDRLESELTAKALLLISADLGDERNVLKKLKSIQNVKEAYLTYGVYDIIAIVEAETQDRTQRYNYLPNQSAPKRQNDPYYGCCGVMKTTIRFLQLIPGV